MTLLVNKRNLVNATMALVKTNQPVMAHIDAVKESFGAVITDLTGLPCQIIIRHRTEEGQIAELMSTEDYKKRPVGQALPEQNVPSARLLPEQNVPVMRNPFIAAEAARLAALPEGQMETKAEGTPWPAREGQDSDVKRPPGWPFPQQGAWPFPGNAKPDSDIPSDIEFRDTQRDEDDDGTQAA